MLYSRVSSCSWLYSMLAHLSFTASVAGITRAKIGRTLISTRRAMSCSMAAFLLGTTFTGQRQAAPRSRRILWPCMCGTHEGAMQYRTSTRVHCHQDVALSCGRFSCRWLHFTSLTRGVGPHDMNSFSMLSEEHATFSLPACTSQPLALRRVMHVWAAYRVRQRFPTPLCNCEASDGVLERLDSKCICTC